MSRDSRSVLGGSRPARLGVPRRLGDAAQRAEAVINPYVTAVLTRVADAAERWPRYRHRLNDIAGLTADPARPRRPDVSAIRAARAPSHQEKVRAPRTHHFLRCHAVSRASGKHTFEITTASLNSTTRPINLSGGPS